MVDVEQLARDSDECVLLCAQGAIRLAESALDIAQNLWLAAMKRAPHSDDVLAVMGESLLDLKRALDGLRQQFDKEIS